MRNAGKRNGGGMAAAPVGDPIRPLWEGGRPERLLRVVLDGCLGCLGVDVVAVLLVDLVVGVLVGVA